jgi:Histidine kinase-, DNA gyrase B-, and HSP90-like ATPase
MAGDPDTFQQVLRTHELLTRFRRDPDYASENHALIDLARTLATHPRQILQALATAAWEVCAAGSAGVSTLDSETGGDASLFRWRALAGAWAAQYPGTTVPRDFCPCGLVLSRNSMQLMVDPAVHYSCLAAMDPPCREVLSVPFGLGEHPIGTIWLVQHQPDGHFDAEDARRLKVLAGFASAAYQALKAIEAADARLGVVELNLLDISLADVVRAALTDDRLRPAATSHRIEAHLNYSALRVLGHFDRLAQVFHDLLDNAARFTAPGGHIVIHLLREGPHAVVSITDSGIGIAAEYMSSIFARGNRLHLAKQLVAAHGGNLTAESRGSGHGSTFYVRLPIFDTGVEPGPTH